MITPRFDVTQDDEFVIVTMRVPYIKVADMEYSIVETQFTFFAKPYFLRLTFPHTIVEDGREKAQYDIDKGTLVIRLPKEEKGQFFDNLDMLTQLLARRKPAKSGNPLIEVISEKGQEEEVEDDDEEEDFDWEQTLPDPDQPVLLGLSKNKYGFNKQYSDFFEDLQEDLSDIVSIPNPDETPSDTWRSLRTHMEDDKFDPEHYMADFMMDTEIKELLAFKTQGSKDLRRKLALKKKRKAQAAQDASVANATATPATGAQANNDVPTRDAQTTQSAPTAPNADTTAQNADTTAHSTGTTAHSVDAIAQSEDAMAHKATTSAASDITQAPPNGDEPAHGGARAADATHATQETSAQAPAHANLTPASIVSAAFLSPASIATTSFLASSALPPSSPALSSPPPSSLDPPPILPSSLPVSSSTSLDTTPASSSPPSSSVDTPSPAVPYTLLAPPPATPPPASTTPPATSPSPSPIIPPATSPSPSSPPSSSSNVPSSNREITKQNRDEEIVQFIDEIKEVLMRLPSKEYIISNEKSLLLGLVDIVFAYCYNHRTTQGENSVESAWTIGTLSPTLSCLETFNSLQGVIIANVRRALAYPLYRNWKLTQQILKDTTIIFRLGKRAIIRALLETHKLFELHDTKRYLNSLYVTDYCIWLQKLGRSKFKAIYKKLKNLEISKDLIGWPLEYLEQRAREEFMPIDAE